MAVSEFNAALNQVATERGISVESVIESIELALKSAYRKDYGDELPEPIVNEDGEEIEAEITAKIDPETGEAKILDEDGEDITPSGFGRIAAQTAKQVILQKIRETEKEVVLEDFRGKVGTLVNGQIFRMDNGVIILDLGRAHGILPQSEQVKTENYRLNMRLKVYVKDVREGTRGTEIIVSRAAAELVEKLFEQEVPEIASGTVVIESIAREAGSRTKMAVSTSDDKIDPVGSCVGQKGVRVQSIISELFGEKIDIVPYSASIDKFIASSLSPAKVTEVEVDLEKAEAKVSVPEDQLSLAIGKDGQNVRLAAKLTKWRIDIKGTANIFGGIESTDELEDDKVVRGIWDADIKAAKDDAEAAAKEHSDDSPEVEEPDVQDSADVVDEDGGKKVE